MKTKQRKTQQLKGKKLINLLYKAQAASHPVSVDTLSATTSETALWYQLTCLFRERQYAKHPFKIWLQKQTDAFMLTALIREANTAVEQKHGYANFVSSDLKIEALTLAAESFGYC